MFFVAYNWTEVGRFAQFTLVEISIVFAIVVYSFSKTTLISQVSLVVATFLLGILLALFGQTYQTGADTWQLFFTWAILMLPWAIVGRFSPLWILWLVLINLSIVLYHDTFNSRWGLFYDADTSLVWSLFIFNILAHIIGEILIKYRSISLGNWYIYLVSLAHGIALTSLVFMAITDDRDNATISIILWFVYIISMYHTYKNIKQELFILAGLCLSSIVIIMTFLIFHIIQGFHVGVLLFLAMVMIALGTASTLWLKNIQKEWQDAKNMG
jgi:uncharacterized membrane protein